MDIKERLYQEEIKKAKQQPATQRLTGRQVKIIMFCGMFISGMFAGSLMKDNRELRDQIRANQPVFNPPTTMQPTPVIFSPYVIQDNTPDCAGPVMTLNGQPICATMDPI